MRVLLDECADSRLARELAGHEVTTVPEAGWAGTRNGELLALAEQRFDAFLTVDRNLSFQQPLPKFRIAVVVIRATSNRLRDLLPLVPQVLAAPPLAKHGEVTWVGG